MAHYSIVAEMISNKVKGNKTTYGCYSRKFNAIKAARVLQASNDRLYKGTVNDEAFYVVEVGVGQDAAIIPEFNFIKAILLDVAKQRAESVQTREVQDDLPWWQK